MNHRGTEDTEKTKSPCLGFLCVLCASVVNSLWPIPNVVPDPACILCPASTPSPPSQARYPGKRRAPHPFCHRVSSPPRTAQMDRAVDDVQFAELGEQAVVAVGDSLGQFLQCVFALFRYFRVTEHHQTR